MANIKHLPKDNQACGWYHTSVKRIPKPKLEGNAAARFVVVGAGLTGLAAARQLGIRFPNDQIILVEAQEIGFGTSGRNSGFARAKIGNRSGRIHKNFSNQRRNRQPNWNCNRKCYPINLRIQTR